MLKVSIDLTAPLKILATRSAISLTSRNSDRWEALDLELLVSFYYWEGDIRNHLEGIGVGIGAGRESGELSLCRSDCIAQPDISLSRIIKLGASSKE